MNIPKLEKWYKENFRRLPWRQHKKAYPIWISETMLQQTTSVGVLPYYEKFMKLFPTLKALATAPLEDVLFAWSGLGYYSRARNLHKCAQQVYKLGEFPKSWEELIKLPGIGPYTARAISSLTFEEKVGVLDGNVIRILSRFYNLSLPWWKANERKQLQSIVDQLAQQGTPSIVNQALMELGATICRPKNPYCHLCPMAKNCQSSLKGTQNELPLKKPKRQNEYWEWKVELHQKNNKIALIKNDYLPFLKGQWVFPGSAVKKKKAPIHFHVKHNITHHEIYMKIIKTSKTPSQNEKVKWVTRQNLAKINPSSLLQKALHADLL
ncbi:MAG: A/G-specific adenine glycosylase [Bdellovibrionales bacterium]|nr:A/G-specific adenine glycosylase [Bdellovibrionales bacterium]